MENDETTLLTTRQAAQRLGVPAREFYRLVDVGELPAYKVGRDVRLRPNDVEAYRTAHRTP